MSNNPDNLENQQDQEQEDKRPVLFIPLIIIGLVLVLSIAGFAIASGMGAFSAPTPTPTDEATEVAEVTETDEATAEIITFTPVPTDEPTDEPTPTATDTPRPTATEEPTDTPTATRPPRTGPTLTPTDTPVCGDLVCNGTESATTCAKDCSCFDDNVCTSAERAIGTCRDCGSNAGTCGAPCTTNAQCNTAAGYTCDLSTNFCDAPFCDPPPPTEAATDEPVTCSCTIVGGNTCSLTALTTCTDGTSTSEPWYCEGEMPAGCDVACACDGSTLDCSADHYDWEYAPQCVLTASNCSCSGWTPDQGAFSSLAQFFCSEPTQQGTMTYVCDDNPNDNIPGEEVDYFGVTCGEAETNGCFK